MASDSPESEGAKAGSPSLGQKGRKRGGPDALRTVIEELERLPGVGRKTAERLGHYLLRVTPAQAMSLAYAIRDLKQNVRYCKECYNVTQEETCSICSDETRDPRTICVVEEPKDLLAIEASGSYRGLYHVLLGTFAPLDGVAPSDLTVDALMTRLGRGAVEEVILAMNPSFEGDGTALYLREKLKSLPHIRLTRLARGMPSGSHLEHVSRTIVSDALEGRREMLD